jgi:hypothetical protein
MVSRGEVKSVGEQRRLMHASCHAHLQVSQLELHEHLLVEACHAIEQFTASMSLGHTPLSPCTSMSHGTRALHCAVELFSRLASSRLLTMDIVVLCIAAAAAAFVVAAARRR